MPGSPNKYELGLVASAARTATGNSGALVFPDDAADAVFLVNCTAASGTTPTLDIVIQTTNDDGTTWFGDQRFAQITSASSRTIKMLCRRVEAQAAAEAATLAATGGASAANGPLSQKIRVLWTIGGTNPSFTFSVVAFGNRGLGFGRWS